MVRVAASTNGLRAEGEPIAGGARPQDGWPVGRAFALRPAGEIQVRTTLVDARSVRPRTRVRFPPPPSLALGYEAVPLILAELERDPDYWFWALTAITGEDPARDETTLQGATERWLEWARNRGL